MIVQNKTRFYLQNVGPEDEFTGGQYQTSTHFNFGDDFNSSASVYTQGE